MSSVKYFNYNNKFLLESGDFLPGFQMAYQTFGKLNQEKNNVIWIVHALTGNSNPSQWWPGVAGNDQVINPGEYFIICANCLGSHYGSTNPLSTNPETRIPYYHSFPQLTNRDIVQSFDLLREHLGIEKVKLLVGASLGGQQSMEWAFLQPDVFDNLCLIGTNARHSPWGIAFNESQRMAIEADQTWKEQHPDAGKAGMKAARSIALLSYRTMTGYNLTQKDEPNKTDDYRASSYQRYQGEKLAKRFNAFSYYTLTKTMDSHDMGRHRGGLENALKCIRAKTTIIGIKSDILFPIQEQALLHQYIPRSIFLKIDSDLGHDGFLTESKQVSGILRNILHR